MNETRAITPLFAVTGALQPADFAEIAAAGFKSVLSNLPDGESRAHPTSEEEAELAARAGLAFRHVPTTKADLFTDRAIRFIRRSRTKPFFLNLEYNAPHWPWQGPGDPPYPDSVSARSGGTPAVYGRMVRSMDDGIGRILAALRDVGVHHVLCQMSFGYLGHDRVLASMQRFGEHIIPAFGNGARR